MFKWLILLAASSFGLLIFMAMGTKPHVPPQTRTTANGFAVLELFTSEGCSSCPPADALLPLWEQLDSNVIPLSFHVDYWNRLGWTDKYSSEQYTQRQHAYAQRWELESVYTPQMIVNGMNELTGSDETGIRNLVLSQLRQPARAAISLKDIAVKDGALSFTAFTDSTGNHSILNIALVEKNSSVMVTAGENKGRNLKHHNIVRVFREMPAQKEISSSIAVPADLKGNCLLVLYLQRKDDLHIIAAAKRDLLVN